MTTKAEDIIAPLQSKTIGARLRNYFLAGIFVIAPVTITLSIAYKFFSFIDVQFQKLLPETYDFAIGGISVPGVGVVLAFVFFVVVGWFASNILGKFLINIGEAILDRIPVIRTLYGAIKQIFETITKSQSEAFREVVMLEYPLEGTWSIGFVTGASKGEIQKKTNTDTVNVFVPTTPNPTSGFLLFVPRQKLKFLDMTVEEGVKLVVSAGIITPPQKKAPAKKKTTAKTTKKAAPKKAAVKKKK